MKCFNISLLALICPALVFFSSAHAGVPERRKEWQGVVAKCKDNQDTFLHDDTAYMSQILKDVKDYVQSIDREKVKEVEDVLNGLKSVEEAEKSYKNVTEKKEAFEKKSEASTIKNYDEARTTYHKQNETAFTELVAAQDKIFKIMRGITSKNSDVESILKAVLAMQTLRRYDASLKMMGTLIPLNKESLKELHEMYTAKSAALEGRIAALEKEFSTMNGKYGDRSDNLRAFDEKLGEMKEIEKEMNTLNCLLIQQSRLVTKKYRDVDGKNADAVVRSVINLISGRAIAGNRSEDAAKICEVTLYGTKLEDNLFIILLASMGAFVAVVVLILVVVLVYKRRHRQV